MYVQFYKTKGDGGQDEIGRATLSENGRVAFEGVPEYIVTSLTTDGILMSGETFFPEAGREFLKLLPFQYNGSVIRAEMKDED